MSEVNPWREAIRQLRESMSPEAEKIYKDMQVSMPMPTLTSEPVVFDKDVVVTGIFVNLATGEFDMKWEEVK